MKKRKNRGFKVEFSYQKNILVAFSSLNLQTASLNTQNTVFVITIVHSGIRLYLFKANNTKNLAKCPQLQKNMAPILATLGI